MHDSVRKDIEHIIKEFCLDRHKIFEVSKQKYHTILKKIEHHFVFHDGTIHRANMGNYKPAIPVWTIDCRDNMLWFETLNEIIPDPESAVYVLFEELRQRPKYWVFEMYVEELKIILRESAIRDYYIISKKYHWLISENHHVIVSFAGEGLNLSPLKK